MDQRKYILGSVIFLLAGLYFAGIAGIQFMDEKVEENMDIVFTNIAYSALFFCITVYLLHLKDEKTNRTNGK
ncbi:protein YpmT [Metabacillus sp. 84]|uniref:protein YpmT n=1 Tax=unclassified Metabacillus TaxID=2675274 RepID=UPI003CEA32BA